MSQFALLGRRRFAPFFAVQALAAFNDNAFRQATIVLVGFQLGLATATIGFYSNLAPAVFILPFFLFSATAGQLAEKFEKQQLIRWIRVLEIVAIGIAVWGFYAHSVPLLFVVLFLMGVLSTLFGPIKYAILPQVLHPGELVGGNGLVEAGTNLAILIGMVAGGAAMASRFGWLAAGALVAVVAVAGLVASFLIPRVPAVAPRLRLGWNLWRESARVLRITARDRTVFTAVLGISWFWFFGGVVTAQLPNYTRLYLGGDASVEILVLTLFSIGVGVGSLLCEKLSRHTVDVGLVPLGATGMTLFGALPFFTPVAAPGAPAVGWLGFLATRGHDWLALDLALLGVSAGLFIVPLFATVQQRSAHDAVSRVIAGNNIWNAVFLVAAALFGIALLHAGCSIPQLFLITALLNAVALACLVWRTPWLGQRCIAWLLRRDTLP